MEHRPIAAAPPRPLATLRDAPWGLPVIVAFAIALRLAVMLAWPQTPFSDAGWYMARAAELARGMGYQEAGFPTAFWPVGYPALLAGSLRLAGGTGPMLVNLVAAGASVMLIARIADLVGAGRLAGRLAALGYALYPAAIVYAGAALSEVASTAVMLAGYALLLSGRRQGWRMLAAGGVFGVATLMRAQLMYFPIGVLVAMTLAWRDFGWRRAAGAALLCYAAMAAVVLPWTLRNAAVLGSPVLVSTNGGVALMTGAYDGATGEWTGWETTPVWDRSGIAYADRVSRQVELDTRFKALAKAWIVAHPARWGLLGIKKAALVWRKDSDAFWGMHQSYPAQDAGWTAVALLDQLYYFAMLALAVPALCVGVRGIVRRRDDAGLALLGCMPAFVTLTAFAFTGQVRYHFPAMPFLAVAAGWSVARLLNRRSGSGRPAAGPSVRTR